MGGRNRQISKGRTQWTTLTSFWKADKRNGQRKTFQHHPRKERKSSSTFAQRSWRSDVSGFGTASISPKTALDAQASTDEFVAGRVSQSDSFCQSTSTTCFPSSSKNVHDVRKSSQAFSSIGPKRCNKLGMDRLRKCQADKNTALARMAPSASSTEDWLDRVRHAVRLLARWKSTKTVTATDIH